LLAVRSRTNGLQVWDFQSRTLVGNLQTGPSFWGGSAEFLPTGHEMVRSTDRFIQRWPIGTDTRPVTVSTTSDRILAMAVSRDGKYAAAGTAGNRIEVFEISSGAPFGQPLELPAAAVSLAMSPDDRLLAVGDRLGAVHLYDLPVGTAMRTWRESNYEIAAVAFSPDGQWLGVAGRDGLVRVRRVPSGELAAHLPGHPGGASGIAFSPDGSTLATCGDDRVIQLWQLPSLRGELADMGLSW
jgi:WD40 repeat protein